VATTADETLADEQRVRTRAAVAAVAAGLLTIGGGVATALVNGDKPTVPVLGALREHFAAEPPKVGLKARQVIWYADNGIKVILAALLLSLAAGAIGFALATFYRFVKARRPELPRGIVTAAIAGAVLVAVAGMVQSIGLTVQASSFKDAANQSSAVARDALASPTILAAGLLQLVGVFALGLAFVLLALNGMRVGLLTRFMGVLGIIVGVLFIVPIGSPLPIVQSFWLVALGALFLGRWPSGMPPAWVTGEAQPWPSQQELREARIETQGERKEGMQERPRFGVRRARPEPPETPAPELPERRPHPSSKKKKRKRR
jgi:MFS family permease